MGYPVSKDAPSSHAVVTGTGRLRCRVGLAWASIGGAVTIVDSKANAASEALFWIRKELPG